MQDTKVVTQLATEASVSPMWSSDRPIRTEGRGATAKWACLSIIVSRTTAFTGEVPALLLRAHHTQCAFYQGQKTSAPTCIIHHSAAPNTPITTNHRALLALPPRPLLLTSLPAARFCFPPAPAATVRCRRASRSASGSGLSSLSPPPSSLLLPRADSRTTTPVLLLADYSAQCTGIRGALHLRCCPLCAPPSPAPAPTSAVVPELPPVWLPKLCRQLPGVPAGPEAIHSRVHIRMNTQLTGQPRSAKRAGTSLCTCLYTQNIKRQVHCQSLD